jgi:hypothetical protein
VNPVPGK